MRLVYFARVREMIGMDGEHREFPESVLTVADALNWLSDSGANYSAAFADRNTLRFALDQQMVFESSPLEKAEELAIFPPVTGG